MTLSEYAESPIGDEGYECRSVKEDERRTELLRNKNLIKFSYIGRDCYNTSRVRGVGRGGISWLGIQYNNGR